MRRFGILLFVVIAAAAERVDFYDAEGRRSGYAVVDRDTGRVDYYDANSRRTGHGRAGPDGRLDQYDADGRRRTAPPAAVPPPPGRTRGRDAR